MGHLNDHRSTTSLVERYIGTPYDRLMVIVDNITSLLKLLEYYENQGSVNDARYTHSQTTASTIWTVTHNLAKFPSIETVDSSLEEIAGEVTHVDNDNLTITFNQPVSGFAYVN